MKNDHHSQAVLLRNVHYSIPVADGVKTLLRHINLSVSRGEWLAIVGTNGSGKSTLAKLIAKLHPVSSGEIVHIRSVGDVAQDSPVQKPFVQMVFQNPDTQLFGETVYEEVCFGLTNYGFEPEERHRLAMQALDTAGLTPLTDYPARFLSGGQKQLLHAASCIAVQPEVLIFDEATAMLDPLSRQRLLATIHKLHEKGRTIVWITQLLDELDRSDRIVALEDGQIAFEGSKEAFFYSSIPGDDAQSGEAAPSPCERLGFLPPYTIQVAQELIRRGHSLNPLPFTIEQLGKAVTI